MERQYWVIGGDYRDTTFTRVIEGTLKVDGPYPDKAEATRAWSSRAQATRHQATTRFTIAESPSQ